MRNCIPANRQAGEENWFGRGGMGLQEKARSVPRGEAGIPGGPGKPYHDPALQKDRTILLHCASGGRSALAGKTLQDMGDTAVFNTGGFKDLTDAGIGTEPA